MTPRLSLTLIDYLRVVKQNARSERKAIPGN
jgi:hypothetical protein